MDKLEKDLFENCFYYEQLMIQYKTKFDIVSSEFEETGIFDDNFNVDRYFSDYEFYRRQFIVLHNLIIRFGLLDDYNNYKDNL